MHWMRLAALPALLTLGAAHPLPALLTSYELAPEMQGDTIVALDVTIRVAASRTGTTTIDWVDSWAGEHKLGQWARDVSIEGGTSSKPAPNGGRIVRSAPHAPLVMRYRIVSAYDADPDVDNSEQAKPVVRPGWFYAVGEALYARPTDRDGARASFTWKGPAGIGFASDTEHLTGLGGKPRSIGDILESIAIGGRDLSVSTVTVNGDPVRVAHVDSFGFDVHAFEGLAEKVVATERDFWRDGKAGPFLITAIPLAPKPGRLSYGGTGRSDAFATWIDRDAELPGLAWLLAHEYFHSWNARQLGRFGDKEGEAYWVSEGFTDFYARRLMLRAGIWTPEQFARDWNEMLRAYAASPYRAVGNADAAAKFWSDRAAEKIPYQRGSLLAALWDRQLQAKGLGDLDTVLRAQRDRVHGLADDRMPLLTAAFIDQMRRAGLDIRPDVARYIDKGMPLLLPEDAFGACARVTTADVPLFERGWDSAATQKAGNVLTGVDPASNAYAAGLRDGMKIVRRVAGEPGNSAVDYVLEVEEGGTKRTVTFRPAGKTALRTQQIVLDAARFAAEPGKCKAALAG